MVIALDQTLKILVKTNMTLGQNIYVLGDWFILHFTENYGMAFGLEFSGEYGKLALSLLRIAAVGFIGWYLHKLIRKHASTGLIVCISLIMAGAIGNIIDSTFYGLIFSESYFNRVAEIFPRDGGYGTLLHGRVVDMFYFPVISGAFPEWIPVWGGQDFVFFRPVFNIADSAITLGVIILFIFQKKFFPPETSRKQPDATSHAAVQQEHSPEQQPSGRTATGTLDDQPSEGGENNKPLNNA